MLLQLKAPVNLQRGGSRWTYLTVAAVDHILQLQQSVTTLEERATSCLGAQWSQVGGMFGVERDERDYLDWVQRGRETHSHEAACTPYVWWQLPSRESMPSSSTGLSDKSCSSLSCFWWGFRRRQRSCDLWGCYGRHWGGVFSLPREKHRSEIPAGMNRGWD